MNKREYLTIYEIIKIKEEYALKACEENGKNEITNDVLWYAGYVLKLYDKFGTDTKIYKQIRTFRKANWELCAYMKQHNLLD